LSLLDQIQLPAAAQSRITPGYLWHNKQRTTKTADRHGFRRRAPPG